MRDKRVERDFFPVWHRQHSPLASTAEVPDVVPTDGDEDIWKEE